MVGWLEGRAVRMFLGSYRGDGRTRYYIARRARPMLIHRYEPRTRTRSRTATNRNTTRLMSLISRIFDRLFPLLGALIARNLLAKARIGGVRPPRFLPESAKNLDVPL